jgi:hypothetical protein
VYNKLSHTYIGWFWYQTCIHYLVHFRQHHIWHKLKWRVLANLPKAPKLRIQLVLTEAHAVSDRAMLHCGTWRSIFCFSFFLPLGACHADDIGYLFHSSFTPDMHLDPDDDSLKTLRRMVKMWTNFAKSGYIHYFNRLKHVVCTTFLKFKNVCLQLCGVERSSRTRYPPCDSLCNEDLQGSRGIAPHILNYLQANGRFHVSTTRPRGGQKPW